VDLARTVAPEFQAVTLYAPREDSPEWHNVEVREGGLRFRWSASNTLRWRLPAWLSDRRTLQARIPFLMQIRPGFASECKATIGDRPATVELREGAIFADLINVSSKENVLVLHTPNPMMPAALTATADTRTLGLALPLEA
jgi:hypothetical protein